MKNITNSIRGGYQPTRGLIVYESQLDKTDFYLEGFETDEAGRPINLHVLTVEEATALARALDSQDELSSRFLQPAGLLPKNVIYLKASSNGFAIWHTPAQQRYLLFSESLGLPCGLAPVPAMVWKADKESLNVYALSSGKINQKTSLYHAPFFNIFREGNVCMGTVEVSIGDSASLEEFMSQWDDNFYNSYFSHLVVQHQPTQGNTVELWKGLLNKATFPTGELVRTGKRISDILS